MVLTRSESNAPVAKEELSHFKHLFKVTGLSESTSSKSKISQEPADFEAAIAATGYGRFNVYLLLCAVPAFWSAVSVPSSVSYIFARAQCDMKLNLMDMGTINAMTYGGMISSAMLWGYISDTLGRRRVMGWGFVCTGAMEILSSLSQNFTMLLVTRFFCGFFFNGPFAVVISYIAELHRTELRARIMLLTNLFYTVANTTLPLLAWSLLIHDWDFYFFGNRIVLHSWNLFLLAASIAPLLTGLAFFCLPESPKFLMSRRRNEEAMEVFRKIYSMNTGNAPMYYPVTSLVEEKSEQQESGLKALRAGFAQLAPLFKAPHGPWLLLLCLCHLGCMFGMNTLRLWYPQLAAMLGSTTHKSLCTALLTSKAPALEGECVPIPTDMMTYLQSAIVGAGSVLTFLIGGALVNICGKTLVAAVSGIASAVFVVMIPFLGNYDLAVVAMVTTTLAFTSLFGATLSSEVVDLFPTSLRVMAMAIFLMHGRLGTIIGAVVFPALIDFGCYPPFITIAAVLAGNKLEYKLCGNFSMEGELRRKADTTDFHQP